MCMQNLKFVALPVPEITVIGVLGGVRSPILNLREGKAVRGRGAVGKSVGEFL